MGLFIVTVKRDSDPNHNPHMKLFGDCPESGRSCTDTTGAHHSVLVQAPTLQKVRAALKGKVHITRIEEVTDIIPRL